MGPAAAPGRDRPSRRPHAPYHRRPSAGAGQKDGAAAWRSLGAWAEGFFLAAIKRGGQSLEARLLAERLFDAEPDAWIAICGDCNAELREVPLLIAAGAFEDARDPALLARRLSAVEDAVPANCRYSLRHDGRALMLDQILVSPAPHATLRMVEIDNIGLAHEIRSAGPTPGSPHAPMVAVFEAPEGELGDGQRRVAALGSRETFHRSTTTANRSYTNNL